MNDVELDAMEHEVKHNMLTARESLNIDLDETSIDALNKMGIIVACGFLVMVFIFSLVWMGF